MLTLNCANHEVIHLAAQFPWAKFALETNLAAGDAAMLRSRHIQTCQDKSKAPVTMMDPQMRSSALPQRPLEPHSQTSSI